MKLLFVLVLVLAFVCPAMAINFPVSPLGMCYDGCQKMITENAYPGAKIAYNSQMGDGQGHVWLVADGKVIDAYYGEMLPQTAGYQAEATFDTWEEFDDNLPKINVTDL